MQLQNKTVILTGATGGIGQALAKQLDARGARLILIGRNAVKLDQLCQQLHNDHIQVVADLTVADERRKIIDSATAHGQAPHILINNAGISMFSLFTSMNDDDISDVVHSNLTAPMQLTRSLLPHLDGSSAQIINIGSTFGAIGYPGFTAYGASKFGLRGFSEALSRELADKPVVIKHVAPRATRTNINSNAVNKLNERLGNRVDDPVYVAAQICRLIESDKKSMVIGWPEKFFVWLNWNCMGLISRSIHSQLPIIKRYAQEN